MVDEEAVYAAISVLKWMNENEHEGYQCSRDYRVDFFDIQPVGKIRPPLHQIRNIFGLWTNKMYLVSVTGDGFSNKVLEISPVAGRVSLIHYL
ncbi:hypothetical protein D3C85_1690910 [compost metagenome]